MKYSRASIGKYKVLHKEKYVADPPKILLRVPCDVSIVSIAIDPTANIV